MGGLRAAPEVMVEGCIYCALYLTMLLFEIVSFLVNKLVWYLSSNLVMYLSSVPFDCVPVKHHFQLVKPP